ncbi:MAG: hypothetical protein KAT68_10655 [Bacteroidales bacterium]|nr:hypothetical protein [Bacteroidales bacterium]
MLILNKNLFKPLLICMLIVYLIFVTGCKKDNNGMAYYEDFFEMNFTDNDDGRSWAILHTLDGKSIIDAKRITGNTSVDFGKINNGRVTVTYINVYGDNYGSFILIQSLYNVPAGEWNIKGSNLNLESLGKLDLTIKFPENEYDEYMICLPNLCASGNFSESNSEKHFYTSVYWLDDNQKLTCFASVYKENSDKAFCNWLTNETFTEGDTNYYSLELNKQMQTKSVISSRSLNNIDLDAYVGSKSFMQYNSYYYDEEQTDHFLCYSFGSPVEKLQLRGGCYNNNEYYSMTYIDNDIPSIFNISEASVDADYNNEEKKFENISVTGTADEIFSTWHYYSSSQIAHWFISANADADSITMPTLPDSILSDIGLDISVLNSPTIGITNYDSAKNLDDLIKMFFKTDANLYDLYKTLYYYEKSIDQTKKMGNIDEYRPYELRYKNY